MTKPCIYNVFGSPLSIYYVKITETFRPLRSLIYQFLNIYEVIFARFGQKFRSLSSRLYFKSAIFNYLNLLNF